MKKQTLLLLTSLALLPGCGNKNDVATTPGHTLAAVDTSRSADTSTPAQASEQPPQSNNAKRQRDTAAPPDLSYLAIGEKVYKGTCSICHKTGLNGAPRIGNKKDWEPRLAQGNEVLYSRAINGYRGSKGSMPSRGSNPRLSDAEIRAAVDYIVANAIPSWSLE
jgi:cytochrome c5